MPPSSQQDAQPIPFNRASTPKQAQKGTPPGPSNLTKKGRKNGVAKDGGGTPPVMKSGQKSSDTTETSSASTPSHGPSPEVKPTSALPVPSKITSPLLDALSSNAFHSSTAQNTNEWARNVPAFSGSPGNLISLSGSPPTVPSSYEDRSILAGWNHRERSVANGHLPSASPPTNRRRPLSFQMDGHQPFEEQASQRMGYPYRRSSMYSQQSQRYGSNPPLPHQPQAHFYGAPDPTLGLPSKASGISPGTHGYYCGFDSLSLPRFGAPKPVDSVFISGYEGGLDVYGISKHGLKKTASIEGLRGGVYYAKILPWTTQGENQTVCPLIALVIHGPVLPTIDASIGDHTVQAASESGSARKGGSIRDSPQQPPTTPFLERNGNSITHFQTTVEVYSLNSKKRVCSLLSLPTIPLTAAITSPLFSPPPPMGALKIAADLGNIVVVSGTTGELWIYHQTSLESHAETAFRCTGKIWTTVQQVGPQDPSRSPDLADGNTFFADKHQQKSALFSLKGRWLAYCPPSASQVPLRAVVSSLPSHIKSPGLNTYAPPQVPVVNCAVDIPEGETLLNRVAREATQAAIKGAKWVGDQGYQAWSNYWNKPIQANSVGAVGQIWHGTHQPPQDIMQGFPPTHGEALQHAASNADPTLVSILDIEKLATSRTTSSVSPPHPFATFKAPLGCSFLSFSPSGLGLFTASSKGEVQFVWDLMRVQHTKSSALQTPHLTSLQGQHVRQIAIFTRMTPARIVDIVWTPPHGDRIAMVTDRNTVHFWDLPPSAFSWPPLRRRTSNPSAGSPVYGDIMEGPKSAAAIATSAVSAAWNLAQPLIKRPRGLSGPGRPGITAASVTAQAGHGGKVLAHGISKSFGAATGTLENFYKSGENRLHLPRTSSLLKGGCIKWLGGQNRDHLAAIVDGVVMIYIIKQRKTKKADKQQIFVGRNPLKIELPLIPDYSTAPAVLQFLDLEDELDLTQQDKETKWDLDRTSVVKADATSGTDSSIPQAEIESNAPYQPFHTDRRVGLYVYSTACPQALSPSVSALLAPISGVPHIPHVVTGDSLWVFGGPITTVKLEIGPSQVDDDEVMSSEAHHALPTSAMERVTTKISEADEDVEQIVITTRRRRGTIRGEALVSDGDGFFEDDCEVLDFASQRV